MAAQEPQSGLSGITGWVADVIATLGEVGVGLLTALETVFPPIPSEVVLPLAGYLAQRGRLDVVWLLVAATFGSLLGSLVLYGLGARLGADRSTRLLAKLPLVEERDVERAIEWFERHGTSAVFLGRLVPGVRSFISLPAGVQRMSLVRFSVLTVGGSLVWNVALVGAGMALGTQWKRVEQFSTLIDVVLVGALVLLVGGAVLRRLRKRRARAHSGSGAPHSTSTSA